MVYDMDYQLASSRVFFPSKVDEPLLQMNICFVTDIRLNDSRATKWQPIVILYFIIRKIIAQIVKIFSELNSGSRRWALIYIEPSSCLIIETF